MTANGKGVSLRLENCAKTYPGGIQVLSPMTLEIARGETVVLLGPSGCGKTTTLRIIAGLIQPDHGGRVLFDGVDVTSVPIEKRNVGMVFQSYALFPNMTVAGNIGYGLKIRHVPKAERRKRVDAMMQLVGIDTLHDRRVDQLSGGQRQRVALARAVACQPRVLLLDEPLTALDASLRDRLRTDLNQLFRSLGITTIYVTHDQGEAMALGDRIVVMTKGTIAQVGTPDEIYFRPANRFVAEFIGAANILEGPLQSEVMLLPGGQLHIDGGRTGDTAVAMVRPEAIGIVSPDGASWTGRIQTKIFLGDRLRLTVAEAATSAIVVDASNRLVVQVGDRVGLTVPNGSVRLLTS